MKKVKWSVVSIIGVLIVFSMLSLTPSYAVEMPKSIGIATHPKGSLMNIIGSGFGKVLSGHLPLQATDRPFTGYAAWLPLMDRGDVELGILTCTDAHFGYHGIKPYREKLENLRIISSGSAVVLGYVVREDSGIKSLADLKGKRVCIDYSSVSTRLDQEVVLQAAGLDIKKDIKVVPTAGVVEPVNAVMEGRSDATWASVGMSAVRELIAKVGGIFWLPLCDTPVGPRAKTLLDASPGITLRQVEAGKLPTVDNDTCLIFKPIYLVTHKKMKSEVIYEIIKTIWNNNSELGDIHPMLKQWNHEAMVSNKVVIPYHEGAVRFYKEVGAWGDEMDEVQLKVQ